VFCVLCFLVANQRSTVLGSFLEANTDQPKPAAESVVEVAVVPSSSEGNSASVKKKNKKKADLNTTTTTTTTVERDDGTLAGILKLGRTGLGSGAFLYALFRFLFFLGSEKNNKSQEPSLRFWIHSSSSACVTLDLNFQGKLSLQLPARSSTLFSRISRTR